MRGSSAALLYTFTNLKTKETFHSLSSKGNAEAVNVIILLFGKVEVLVNGNTNMNLI